MVDHADIGSRCPLICQHSGLCPDDGLAYLDAFTDFEALDYQKFSITLKGAGFEHEKCAGSDLLKLLFVVMHVSRKLQFFHRARRQNLSQGLSLLANRGVN